LGERSTIIGQRGREVTPPARAFTLDLANLGDHGIGRGGHQPVHGLGIVALDEVEACSRSR
jgi:hypothetical protein